MDTCVVCGKELDGDAFALPTDQPKSICNECNYRKYMINKGEHQEEYAEFFLSHFDRMDDDVIEALDKVMPSLQLGERRKIADQQAEEKRRQEAEAIRLAAEYRARKKNFVISTTNNIEGRTILKYLGLACGTGSFNPAGFLGEGLSKTFGSVYAQGAVDRATEAMAANALKLGADAIVGVTTDFEYVKPYTFVYVTGTAVKLGD